MKILNFFGSRINEYIDVDIKFNDDLTILTGINGAGKTTSLNLIQAILLPKIEDLFTIPFEKIELKIEFLSRLYSFIIVKNKNSLTFDIFESKIKFVPTLVIPRDFINEYDLQKIQSAENKKIDIFFRRFKDEDYFKFIDKLNKPTLIGLERTNIDIAEDYKDYLFERNLFLRKDNHSSGARNKANLGISTLETEMLVQNVYKRVREIRDSYYKVINKELITRSFDFIEFSIEDLQSNTLDIKEKFRILEKKDEIEETLKSIGFLDADLSQKLRLFFEKIENILKQFDKENTRITLEWLLNKSQIDKLHKVLNIIDDYNSKANKIFEPVNKFLDLINTFFKDSGKRVFIDAVGRLLIGKPQGRNLTIDELSSGERQLVILFANVIFGKYTPKRRHVSDVFIIDEPEISLHIRWQENFISSLLKASSETQFIVATHSPDIIGEYKHKAERVSKKIS